MERRPAAANRRGADAADAERDPSPEERAAELREKLPDLEAALAAFGGSGLPYATRHPNRFASPFDAARLRAEPREIRRELADLETRPGARPRCSRTPRPRAARRLPERARRLPERARPPAVYRRVSSNGGPSGRERSTESAGSIATTR